MCFSPLPPPQLTHLILELLPVFFKCLFSVYSHHCTQPSPSSSPQHTAIKSIWHQTHLVFLPKSRQHSLETFKVFKDKSHSSHSPPLLINLPRVHHLIGTCEPEYVWESQLPAGWSPRGFLAQLYNLLPAYVSSPVPSQGTLREGSWSLIRSSEVRNPTELKASLVKSLGGKPGSNWHEATSGTLLSLQQYSQHPVQSFSPKES